jgi:peroxiredoxin family protein
MENHFTHPSRGGHKTMSEENNGPAIDPNTMSIIVTKGSLDWAYPPFILGTTAAAMGLEVTMFFTFYGLPLLLKKMDLKVTPLGNAAMKMPMMGGHMVMPNIVAAIPGVDAMASKMMKNLIKKNGVASIEELRELAVEADVRMIGCQMTMDLFDYQKDEMIDGIEVGGAATYIEVATKSHINLFI